MKLTNRISFKLKRIQVKLRKRAESKVVKSLQMNEDKAAKIFIALIKDPDSKFSVAPITGEKLIENKKLVMFANLTDNRITIINSVYQYDIPVAFKTAEWLNSQFNDANQKRSLILKKQWERKVSQSLESIMNEVEQSRNLAYNE